jgi:sugar/nucleoside kinase (ribokinase family)
MTMEPPSPALDLLVIGALTLDQFTDGEMAPGGTVLHAVRAAVAAGYRTGAVALAGSEPVAQRGVAELESLTAALVIQQASTSVAFAHDERAAERRLTLLDVGGRFEPLPALPAARAVLMGPVSSEIEPHLARLPTAGQRGAILQGWLRQLAPGAEVRPLPLSAIPGPMRAALSEMELLVASRDDLAAEAADPAAQLAALRDALGPRPALVVTDGAAGLWLSAGGPIHHFPPPFVVRGRSTVGAGDMLAALLLVTMPDADPWQAAVGAMAQVAGILAERPVGS